LEEVGMALEDQVLRSNQGPDEPEQDDTQRVFNELGRIVLGDAPLNQMLQQVALLATRVLPGASDVSITLLNQGPDGRTQRSSARTVAFAKDLAVHLDERQYQDRAGPCLDASQSEKIIRVDADQDGNEEYPEFVAACRRAGVHQSLSVPLPVPQRVVGALNVYGGPFTDEEVEMASAFAGQAAVAVANAALHQASIELSQNLQRAMESRAVIEQAKGIIMGQRRCTADEAFESLRTQSQQRNIKLRDIAQDVVHRTTGR
jgi:GAF domain-containing protein